MTYVSNRRPGSRTVLLAWLICGTVLCGAVWGAETPSSFTIRLAAGTIETPELRHQLAADKRWLSGQPSSAFARVDSSSSDVSALRAVVRSLISSNPAEQTVPVTGGRAIEALLRDGWLARGYLACRVRRLQGETGTVFEITPGPLYAIGTVALDGQDFPGRAPLLARLLPRTGDPCREETWGRTVTALIAAAGEVGYPFARWLVRDVSVDSYRHVVDVDAVLMPGPLVFFGPQASDLQDGRGEDFLVRAARLPVGRPFRESALREGRNRLLQRNIYTAVGEPVVYTTASPDTVGVFWPVTPIANPNRAAVMLGLSRAGEGEPARVSGQVDLRLANLAGTGRRLEMAWSDDGRDRSHFGLGWLEPLVRGTPFDAILDVDQEVATDVYTRFRLDGRLQLPVAGSWHVEMGLGWDRSTFPTGVWSRSTRWRARGAFLRRRIDRAASEWWGTFAIESARRAVDVRIVEGEPSPARPAEERQTLVDLRLAGERWLSGTLSVAATGLYQEVSGDTDQIPLSEQYRLGGTRSLRGYLEDQFHGERVASAMLELRIGRPGRSRLYTFFDVGYFRYSGVDPADSELSTTQSGTRRGFGLGIETATPGGDVTLAIGLPGTFQFDDAKLHIAMLQAF